MIFDDLIGKPYRENGRGPDGYDCYGVCVEACKRVNIQLPAVEDLTSNKFIKIKKPTLGDIVLITITEGQHVGVMESPSSLITVHKTGRLGVHRININHPWIRNRIQGFYRYAG